MEPHRTTREVHPVSEHLDVAGNYRHSINQELNLHLLSGSLLSEQQKLRHVLDWADSFLSSGSEICHEFCRADSLILASGKDEKKKGPDESSAFKHVSAVQCYYPVSCTGGSGVLEGEQESRAQSDSPCRYKQDGVPFSFTPGSDEATWPENRETEAMKSVEPQHTATHSQDDCRTSGLHTCNQRPQTDISESGTDQMFAPDAAARLTKESTSGWSRISHKNRTVSAAASTLKLLRRGSDFIDIICKTAGAQAKGERSENQISQDLRKEVEGMVKVKKGEIDPNVMENDLKMHKQHESSAASMVSLNDTMSHSKPGTKTSNSASSCHMKIPSDTTIYEHYQLCLYQLHHLRMRQSQQTESEYLTGSPDKERKTSAETAAPVEAINTKERKENQPVSQKNTVNENKYATFMKNRIEAITSADKVVTSVERCAAADHHTAEKRASFSVSLPKKTECCRALKWHQSGCVKGQKKTNVVWGPQRLCEKSSMSLSALSNGGMLPRSQSAEAITYTRRLDTQIYTKKPDRQKHMSLHRDIPTCLQLSETHTRHHDDDTGPTSAALGTIVHVNNGDSEYSPADVPACDSWLHLPDEVWLSILALLPHSSLRNVAQVCSRLLALATDHTLWKNLRIENSTLTEQWLRFAGTCRPRHLSLYSCSGPSVISCGLEMFFTLCRNSLEEVKVTSCTGSGLHGDQILPLIGQLCDRVISVDVSWSGATDTGIRGLIDGCTGLRLKSVILNGCHVTDEPLKKLVMRYKESLCRLEVFGCQFLSPSCLQTVYELCPGLKHVNIGQLPKVNTHSLTVMTLHLKRLISLNLTGLQAVTDAAVETLLQNCVKLQRLSLSSCPGVTDLTLHSISKYTPCIRSLEVGGCKAVTDAGVQALTLGCRRLQLLDLSSTGAGNRGVTLLANYCSGLLHTVKLSFCCITVENILKLCRRCKRLKVLHLYGCAQLPTESQLREVNTAVTVYPLP